MTSASAQTRDQMIRSRVDSVLAERYYNTPYDTNYVVRPEGRLTLKVRMNQTGNSFHAKGTVDDTNCKADLIKKYGIKSHMNHLGEKHNNYLVHLAGKINFALFINPHDREMAEYRAYIKTLH